MNASIHYGYQNNEDSSLLYVKIAKLYEEIIIFFLMVFIPLEMQIKKFSFLKKLQNFLLFEICQ